MRFKEKPETVNSIKLSDDFVLDLSPDGSIYGIELLNAKEQLDDHLTLINSVTGKQDVLKIAG
ncbi:MAG: DUF2283 domain-containing protein [Chitinophagales bacterium]|nr:DUF2283 domain-containing protein [Chitinophagales bacterium]